MLAGLLLTAALACPEPSTTALTALWESIATSKGGIGHTLEFRSDGSFVEAVTVIVDLHYRLAGDRLFVDSEPVAGDADPREATRVKFEARKLIEIGPDGSVVEKERLGDKPAGESPLIGAWRYRHSTGAIAFERYTPDGRVLFRLPMTSSAGCFVMRGQELTLARTDEAEAHLRYDIRGDELVLTGSSGEPSRYRKDQAGAWYDREHLDYRPPM